MIKQTSLYILLAVMLSQMGCNLLLDTTECTENADCASFNTAESVYTCNTSTNTCEISQASQLVLQGTIVEDTTLEAGKTYTLRGIVYVEQPFKLNIEAGTTIVGEEGSALIVKRGAQLIARGNANAPIVFTSSKPAGSRSSGDWGGVALLGLAKVNEANPILEGVENTTQVAYGGDDDEWSCGVLEYVRVEFGGFAIQKDNELNGLTLAGCGSNTIINYVQVHYGKDDGVEVFGGTVDLRHVVITRAQDDSLDWDRGWRGTAQFVAIQQDQFGDNGIEADNLKANKDAEPRAFPRLYNLTLIGAKDASKAQRAITFKEGTAGLVANTIMMGHKQEGIDVKNTQTVTQLEMDALQVSYTLFFDQGPGGNKYFPTIEEETEQMPMDQRDDDGGFDEASHFQKEMYNNIFGTDPKLKAPFDLKAPDFTTTDANAIQGGIAPPPGFDESATYLGAFAPDATSWTQGWTAYPEN